jgi:hypothetical protein
MIKKLLLALAFIAFLGSAYAGVPPLITTQHFVDGNPVSYGQAVNTLNPFEYNIVFANNGQLEKCFTIEEMISQSLVLEWASMPYDTTAIGFYNKYKFYNLCVPAGGTANLMLKFRNDTGNPLTEASVNTRYVYLGDGYFEEFQIFIFNAVVPAIPEYPLAMIPIGIALGSFFVISRRKVKQ